jgi:Tfp pilus assembly protein PilE
MAMHMMTKPKAEMIVQIAVLALLLISLISYKGAAGIRRIQQARATGALRTAKLTNRFVVKRNLKFSF